MTTCNVNAPISYNVWCKKFKVSSRSEKYKTMWQYRPGEYDCTKFAKMVKSYDKKTHKKQKEQNLWDKIRKTLFSLHPGKV